MFDQVNQAMSDYQNKWQKFVGERKNKEFFERLKPTAVGWKTADKAEYDRLYHEWRDACDQIVEVFMNDRWIAKLHLKDTKLNGNVEIIKLMERRPNSTDAVGLDHMDFLDMEETNTKAILEEEQDVKATEEENGLCEWTSIWFDGTEAKLRSDTVIDVCIAELEETNRHIRGEKFLKGDESGQHVEEVE
jgi:hypothetical protein